MISEEDYDIKIGSLLAQWREDADMTQKEMAEALGISRRAVQELEYGHMHAKNYTVYRWADLTRHNQERDIRRILYPNSESMSDYGSLVRHLHSELKGLYDDELLALDDILTKDHKGNRRVFLHLWDVYLELPLLIRQNLAMVIVNCYEMAKIKSKSRFHPDIGLIKKATQKAAEAYQSGEDRYHIGE